MGIGNVTQHHGIGAYGHVFAYVYVAQQFGAGSNVNVVANLGGTGFIHPAQPRHHTVEYAAVITKTSVAADDDAIKVVDHKVFTQLIFTRLLNSGDDLHQLAQHLVDEREHFS